MPRTIRNITITTIALSFLLLCAAVDPSIAAPIAPRNIKVIDGDTINARGQRWRLVGYDTPEIRSTWRPVSKVERMVGESAKERFAELLRSGRLDLKEVRCSCPPRTLNTKACNHGRRCGLLTRNGENIGAQLIREKLAMSFVCGRSKCPPMPDWGAIISRHQHPQE